MAIYSDAVNTNTASGYQQFSIPFPASYFAVLNANGDVYLADGKLVQNPPNAIYVKAGQNLSAAMNETQSVTVFWANAASGSFTVQFSNQPFSVSTSNAEVQANITNSTLPVSGTVNANITNASVPVSGSLNANITNAQINSQVVNANTSPVNTLSIQGSFVSSNLLAVEYNQAQATSIPNTANKIITRCYLSFYNASASAFPATAHCDLAINGTTAIQIPLAGLASTAFANVVEFNFGDGIATNASGLQLTGGVPSIEATTCVITR